MNLSLSSHLVFSNNTISQVDVFYNSREIIRQSLSKIQIGKKQLTRSRTVYMSSSSKNVNRFLHAKLVSIQYYLIINPIEVIYRGI